MLAKTKVLVVEDNRLVREGLGMLLEAQPDFKVALAAEGGNLGVDRARQLTPGVVLVNAGREASASPRLVENMVKASCARVIVMDLLPTRRDIVEFVKAGASGFIVKDATLEDFVGTIRAVAAGGKVVPPALAGALMTWIAEQRVVRRVPELVGGVRLTKREREVVELIADGLSNKEIAQRLNLATYTVKSHVHNILDKLALHSRLQIVAHVYRTTSA